MGSSIPANSIARWRLNGDATDSVGTYNGTVSGAVFTSGRYGSQQAASFDGVNDYIAIPHNAALKPTGGLSLSAVVYRSSWQTTTGGRIVSNTQSGGFSISQDNGSSLIGFTVNLASTYYEAKVDKSNFSDGWHVITATTDLHYLKLYVDGVLLKTTDTGTTKLGITYTVSNSLMIGAEPGVSTTPDAGYYFTGKTCEVMLWGRALSQSEVADLYAYLTQYIQYPPLTTIDAQFLALNTGKLVPTSTITPALYAPSMAAQHGLPRHDVSVSTSQPVASAISETDVVQVSPALFNPFVERPFVATPLYPASFVGTPANKRFVREV